MRLWHVQHGKSSLLQKLLRFVPYPLAVLQRAGAVIGYALAGWMDWCLQPDLAHQLCNVARQRGYRVGLLGESGIVPEHEAIVLDRGATAGGIDCNCIQSAAGDFPAPRQDVGPSVILSALTEMMSQRTATTGAFRHHHLAAVSGQQPDCGFVDLRREHLLGTPGQQRDAPGPLPDTWENLWARSWRHTREVRGGERQH
jgi:hypothetical protein